jgi:hypothetical protein
MSGQVFIPQAVQVTVGAAESGFWAHAKLIAETLKPFAEIIAYAAAGVFFLYKAASGFFVSNLSLKLSCRRKPSRDGQVDYLSVVASLKKGDKGALKLFDAQVRVTCPDGKDLPPVTFKQQFRQQLIGIERLSFVDRKIKWDYRSRFAPHLNLAPGDGVQFAALCEVASEQPCCVEVVIFGKRWFGLKTGQWRASDISLPAVNATTKREFTVSPDLLKKPDSPSG